MIPIPILIENITDNKPKIMMPITAPIFRAVSINPRASPRSVDEVLSVTIALDPTSNPEKLIPVKKLAKKKVQGSRARE